MNKVKFKKVMSVSLLVVFITGCAGAGPKQTGGQLLGGVAGALAGAQFGRGTGKLFGTAIGALAGSYLGGQIGYHMDERDKQMARETMTNTLETAPDHQVHTWQNPNTQHSGSFRVTRTQEFPREHMVCRDYVHKVIIDGRQEEVHGRACRDLRDRYKNWQVQN